MSGQNAKTNFPVTKNSGVAIKAKARNNEADNENQSPLSEKALSELLNEKLKKTCKDGRSPSLTCLRLDTDSSHIGVWQKRAGSPSNSNWVMRVELGNKKKKQLQTGRKDDQEEEEVDGGSLMAMETTSSHGDGIEDDRLALQMIEELLNWNCPITTASTSANNIAGI